MFFTLGFFVSALHKFSKPPPLCRLCLAVTGVIVVSDRIGYEGKNCGYRIRSDQTCADRIENSAISDPIRAQP
ncbi:hypothetical protein PIB30_003495 [Stylosanthes scabra]|uniref:Secreted protein n=1 Tax=Stylosanthes scabra TaxID=79078 RepID=A0ABU6V6F2_9FABA|nr:hypothetical protein [Stylosanthes scabra]